MANIIWKTKEEIDAEKNQPQPPTELEILKNQVSENQGAIDFIVMNF